MWSTDVRAEGLTRCLFLFTVEHMLSKASGIILAARCTNTVDELLHQYFTKTGTYNQLFVAMDYNLISAILTLVSNFISTFVWNFTDLFVILVSISLAERFRLYNKHLSSIQGKVSISLSLSPSLHVSKELGA